MYRVRIPISIGLFALLFGLLWLDDRFGSGGIFTLAGALLAMRAGYEFLSIAGVPAGGLRRLAVLGIGALLMTHWVDLAGLDLRWLGRDLPLTELVGLTWLLLLAVGGMLTGDAPPEAGGRPADHTLAQLAWIAAAMLYICWPLSFLIKIRLILPAQLGVAPAEATRAGIFLVLYVITVAKCADMGGYLVGKAFGRHKMIPSISPNKSWEGTLGGVVMSVAVAVALAGQLPLGRELAVLPAALLGALMAPISLAGDLVESYLKRWGGVKDSGALIPAFGGILDLIDSLSFCAPAGYLMFLLFFA